MTRDNQGREYARCEAVHDKMRSDAPCWLEFDHCHGCLEAGRRYRVRGANPHDYHVLCAAGQHFISGNEQDAHYLGIYGPHDEEKPGEDPAQS